MPLASQEVEGQVVAEAAVEPARWSELRFEVEGQIVEVAVEPGSVVSEGDLLVRLDPIDAKLAVREARFGLTSARAQLALLQAGPREEEIAVAEAELEAAEAALSQAIAQRNRLTGGATEADVAAAQAELVAAQAEQRQAMEMHRDAHEQIVFYDCLAGQSIALILVLLAEFLRNAVFDRAVLNQHPTFSANTFPAAGGIYVHTGFQGGMNNRFTIRYRYFRFIG